MKSATIDVLIWRGGAQGRYQSYEVPLRENQTVLDVVTFVQRHLDPTLSYRFACRVGMCGSCAMTVNGRPRWTCRTHVAKVASGGRLRIGPLENLPVIKDLATDMRPFFEKWQQAKGALVPSRTRHDPIERILPGQPGTHCGGCRHRVHQLRHLLRRLRYGALESRYLGPAALNRAWSLLNDERDAGNSARLAAVAASGGCHACHSHQSCQEHCPQALNPTASIAGLKRRTMRAYLKGELAS